MEKRSLLNFTILSYNIAKPQESFFKVKLNLIVLKVNHLVYIVPYGSQTYADCQ